MTASNTDGQDHFERLPIEVFQLIIDALPLKETWRLRSISRGWNTYLTSDNAKLGAVTRWNTHGLDDVAALQQGGGRTATEHFERLQRFLSGQPYAWTELKRIGRAAPFVLKGKWFIHTLRGHDDQADYMRPSLQDGRLEPSTICVWDLSTGRRRELMTGRMIIAYMAASKDYVAWLGPQVQDDGSFALQLHIVRLTDLTQVIQEVILHSMQSKLAMDKHCVVLGWLTPDREKDIAHFEIIDCTDGTQHRTLWQFNNAVKGWDFMVDADNRTITLCTSSTWVAGPDSGQPRIEVRITKLSFDGRQISTRAFSREQHDLTALPWSLPSWRLADTGRPGAFATKARRDTRCRKHIVLTIDEHGESSLLTSAFYLSHKPCAVWKDMLFSADAWGRLHIARNTTSTSHDAVSLTAEAPESSTGFAPSYIGGVNESYVLMVCPDRFRIFSFDAPACQGSDSTTDFGANDEYTLEWNRVSDEFVKDRNSGIEASRANAVPRSAGRR